MLNFMFPCYLFSQKRGGFFQTWDFYGPAVGPGPQVWGTVGKPMSWRTIWLSRIFRKSPPTRLNYASKLKNLENIILGPVGGSHRGPGPGSWSDWVQVDPPYNFPIHTNPPTCLHTLLPDGSSYVGPKAGPGPGHGRVRSGSTPATTLISLRQINYASIPYFYKDRGVAGPVGGPGTGFRGRVDQLVVRPPCRARRCAPHSLTAAVDQLHRDRSD